MTLKIREIIKNLNETLWRTYIKIQDRHLEIDSNYVRVVT